VNGVVTLSSLTVTEPPYGMFSEIDWRTDWNSDTLFPVEIGLLKRPSPS
jgi:hypothetical protein